MSSTTHYYELRIDLIIFRVGSGSGHFGFQVKNVGPHPTHVGFGLAHIFMCNFRVESDFFEFRVKYFGPHLTCHLVGLGWVGSDFFRAGWVRFIGLSGL